MTGDILVTGGHGFIGLQLIERLLIKHYEAEAFDARSGHDVESLEQIDYAVRGRKTVFHLAAAADLNWAKSHPLEAMRINVGGTWNVAHACTKHGAALYYASTCCVYGNQPHHPVDETALPNPVEIYACSKLAGENVIRGFHHTYGLQYNHMRFATTYGEGARPALATHVFLGQAVRGEPITVHGDGSQTRTLTHIDDLVDAIMALFESGKMNDTWNMTATREISALQMARDIKHVARSKSEIVFVPQRPEQVMREAVSAEKMKAEVGWETKIEWEDGLLRMYQWFLRTGQMRERYLAPAE